MKAYTRVGSKKTPQSQRVIGKQQIKNAAGGYVFKINDWKRLERFLILGSEGGTYYSSERALTRDNAQAVARCIQNNGIKAVDMIREVSETGRAPKNDPALFALAMAVSLGNDETKRFAIQTLPRVARIGTHLFNFVQYATQFRGWGRLLKRGIADWYLEKDIDSLVYQCIKYQQRNGWSHRDLLRLSHPKGNAELNMLFGWITRKNNFEHPLIEGYTRAHNSKKPDPNIITKFGLTREMLPTEWLNTPAVWESLLHGMPITAMIRNLGKMTSIGVLKPLGQMSKYVAQTLVFEKYLAKARIHPVQLLIALKTYQSGRGVKGSLSWNPVPQISEALEEAFYLSFKYLEPTGKNYLLGIDISGSMGWSSVAGYPMFASEGAAAMAMAIMKSEKNCYAFGFNDKFTDLRITKKDSLSGVLIKTRSRTFGSTDCAVPMLHAIDNKLDVDVFVVITDNETWRGRIHPFQALEQYRQKTGKNAKLVVVGMTSTDTSIVDPGDNNSLDVVGFDPNVPAIISDFAK